VAVSCAEPVFQGFAGRHLGKCADLMHTLPFILPAYFLYSYLIVYNIQINPLYMKYIITLFLVIVLFGCESRYEKCLRHYIDEEGYSYDEACDQCDAEEDAYIESRARN
jgi:hypothetical protein